MKDRHTHLDAERMQALLDGDLPDREAAAVHAEIAECTRCRAEFEGWQTLFGELGDLELHAPSADFEARVLENLPAPRRQRLLAGIFGRSDDRAHATSEELQEHLDGRMAARASARLEEHLGQCAPCRTEMDGLHQVVTRLDGLTAFEPSPGFGEAVMARLRIQQMAQVALAPTSRRDRIVAWLRARMPSTGRSWGAVLGLGTVPAVTAALALQAVFSHDLVTLRNLVSFVGFKLSGVVDALAGAVEGVVADSTLLSRFWDVVQAIGASPTMTAGTVALAFGSCLAALWVLYRNFIVPNGEERYAQVSR